VYLIFTPLGYLALDEKGNVSHYRKLSLEEAIEEGTKLEQGEFTESLKSFVNKLDKKSELKIIDDKIFDTLAKNGYKVKLLEDVKIINLIQKKAKEFLIKEEKLNEEEYYNLIRNFSIEITKIRIKGEQQRRDRIVIQVIESIDELNKTINILVERLVEWYGLYFPELYNILKDNERFTDLIINEPNRFNLNEEILIKLGFSEKISKRIVEAAIKTAGADFDEKDLEIIRSFAQKIKLLYEENRKLESYLEEIMKEIAPNLESITGATIGARLIAKSGGLKELANLPASTIQVLGAEKALFKHLKYGTKPPKHGILFQHPLVHSAPKWQRGKIARLLANKITIAARADYYSQKNIKEMLKRDIEKRIAMIRKLYAEPPKVKKKKKT
jgi:Protein implicated in ribosomal biogenesis, Nop56p homolog